MIALIALVLGVLFILIVAAALAACVVAGRSDRRIPPADRKWKPRRPSTRGNWTPPSGVGEAFQRFRPPEPDDEDEQDEDDWRAIT